MQNKAIGYAQKIQKSYMAVKKFAKALQIPLFQLK